jgi:iron complex transport system substrate-binding protein
LSCNNVRHSPSAEGGGGGDLSAGGDSVRYAVGYTVTCREGYTQVDVRDPWHEGTLLQRYLLVPRDKPLPEGLPTGTPVRVPLRNIVVYSSVHSAALDELGVADEIVGVCESRYIKTPALRERILKGRVRDLGEATAPNVERMIELGTEVVLASPFNHGSYGSVEKTGIPIIECADYMETDPLGRAEWIRFLGLLTDRKERADSLFRRTEAEYLRIKALTSNVTYRPKLLTGKKYGAPWYMPSGESYMARMYKDAGADHLFDYLPGTGSTPLSFETVLEKAIHADIWLIQYNLEDALTYARLKSDYSSYSRFDAFRDRHIYGCNTNRSLYYEEAPIHPDYLLAELIALFHPHLLPTHPFRYFSPLKENP